MKEQMESVYIIEEKLSNKQQRRLIKATMKEKYLSSDEKTNLVKRIKSGWIARDALSYSKSLEEIKKIAEELKEEIKEIRIVKARALISEEYGLSIRDYAYKRKLLSLTEIPGFNEKR